MRIYTITGGDWIAIQLDSGDWFRLTGQKRVVLANQLEGALRNVDADQGILQNVGLEETEAPPCIEEIVPGPGGEAFTAHADDGAEFSLQPAQLKTLLNA